MSIPEGRQDSWKEFLALRSNYPNKRLEYIDGKIINMAPSPSTEHQLISMKLSADLYQHLRSSDDCHVIAAPYDIHLSDDEEQDVHVIIPDISVVCEKEKFKKTHYHGVPLLIVEIVSLSNQSNDLVRKLNLYERYGVKEYWIVNPINQNDEKTYEQIAATTSENVYSSLVEGFVIDASTIFDEVM
ncbi:Uma2 family endonuclease [Shouchella shacheensis]|uniref:Uma2 family endonuclease n=1 Tax=Shouchella shacheensis TaxID=1649580 RepID=UPI00073FFA35|nr:Uma2 family endonuclease [Shouchella shacheensis]